MHFLFSYQPSLIRYFISILTAICILIMYSARYYLRWTRLFLSTDHVISCIGFQATPANLLTVPVYFFACSVTVLVGFLADRWGRRGFFNLLVDMLLVPLSYFTSLSQGLLDTGCYWIYYSYFFTECIAVLLRSLPCYLVCLDNLSIAPSSLTSPSGIYPIIRKPCPSGFIHLIDKIAPNTLANTM
jgi:MFS family permease